jgi:hypothetical protein
MATFEYISICISAFVFFDLLSSHFLLFTHHSSIHISSGFDNQFPFDSYYPRLLMHYSCIHSAVRPMKCDVIAQLTTEIITHLSNLEHEMKFHVKIQFELLETNNIIDIDKIVICLIMILIVVRRIVHYFIKEASHTDGECI